MLDRALAKDPAHRFQSMAELAHAPVEIEPRLRPLPPPDPLGLGTLETLGVRTAATTPSGAASGGSSRPTGARRRGALIVTAVAAIAAVVTAVVITAIGGNRSEPSAKPAPADRPAPTTAATPPPA
ncbi:MAG TPA: hypothetical protein VGO00_14105, partial [Kofleriaceae bacterium]|nr:hypothetical protein [Kofleriaceae bacterium]